MAPVSFRRATRIYPGQHDPAVDALDLEIADGEFLVLVGPSGCGKSTTLRMLAGLEPTDGGSIHIGDADVTDRAAEGSRHRDGVPVVRALPAHDRRREHRVPPEGEEGRQEGTAPPGCATRRGSSTSRSYLDRKPAKLSGGQRQRVAMGRAIVREPKVFLMDEPLSNLDAKLRVQTRTQIAALQRRLGVTTVYVTHDQIEAMTMGDRVAVMNNGVLQQCASPRELYMHPVNVFVAGLHRLAGDEHRDRHRRRTSAPTTAR